jgi:hypothetical protein
VPQELGKVMKINITSADAPMEFTFHVTEILETISATTYVVLDIKEVVHAVAGIVA